MIKRKEKDGRLFSRGRAVRARELTLFVVRMPKEILLNVIFTTLGGKAKRNRFPELDVLPQFQTIFLTYKNNLLLTFLKERKFLKVKKLF